VGSASSADQKPLVQADALQGPRDAEGGELVRPDGVAAAAEEHLARVRLGEAAQDVEQGGLARSVRPDDAHDVPGRHGERNGVERGQAAEADRDAPHLKY
jgi:hypothetical protein